YFYTDRWYNTFAVYDRDDKALKGWYCNICRPAEIDESAVRCDDLALDVWITPAGGSTVLDEDEFITLEIPRDDRRQAGEALQQLLSEANSGRLPY
ncbi:MAG TPA: DUF402 domain-containing protein, partial [Promineifilum sp.]|nr:DUF402 domain-containing protein [Promineifilum sp.]